jgi:hypothetical protein
MDMSMQPKKTLNSIAKQATAIERIRISVGKAFKKLSPSNPICHQSVFKLNSKFIHCAAPIKGFSLGFVHHIS